MKIITLGLILFMNLSIMCSCNNKKNDKVISDTTLVQTDNKEKAMPRERLVKYVNKMDSINKLSYKMLDYYDTEDLSFLEDSRYHPHTSEDIEDLLSLVSEDLRTNGYKAPTEDFFLDKVKTVFQVSPNSKIPYTINHEQFFLILPNEKPPLYRGTQDDFEYDQAILIFSKTHRFVLRTNIWDGNYLRDDNTGQVTTIAPYVIHRNKYLFNDSKSSYTWLVINDSTFLNDLFVNYGYTQDKKLDRWILDNRLNNETIYDFGKAFYYKRFDNTVKFNPEVFEVFEEKANPKYMKQLNYLFSSPNFRDEYDLTFEQKAELFARLMYSAEEVAYKNQTVKIVTKEYPYYPDSFRQYIGTFTGTFKQYIDEDEIYYKEFKRNNFYNLPNFEEYWQSGQNFIEMMTPPQREIEEG